MKLTSTNPQETKKIAEVISRHALPGDVLCLRGELGAGKTQFAKGMARGLGVNEHVTSPTFTLINEYEGRLPFYHIDAYRLEDPDEGYELGLDEYFYGSGITLVEWPSKISALLPENYLNIVIEKDDQDDNLRTIFLEAKGDRYNKLIQELKAECIY